jgi:hypothetical protein
MDLPSSQKMQAGTGVRCAKGICLYAPIAYPVDDIESQVTIGLAEAAAALD